MDFISAKASWLYREFGLASVKATGRDSWLIIVSRCSRMFAYGGTSLIFALFFSALDFSDFYIGLFMTLTLLGDVALSLLLTLIADRVGRRRILLLGSALMVLSGATFVLVDNYWILLAAAVVGVVSANGSDLGPFRAIEESTLSHLTGPKTRSDVLAWYITIASVGSAVGTEMAGRVVESLKRREGWRETDAYHAIFWVYVGMGFVNIACTLSLSDACEILPEAVQTEAAENLLAESGSPSNTDQEVATLPEKKKSLFSQISPETRAIMYKLWFLLMVDTLADGMVSYSLTTYYLSLKFPALPASTLGDIMSSSYFLSSFSTIFAGPLANRLGLINTMVFTHIPSSAAVLLFPLPNSVWLTVTLFFVRTGLNNMDQAPRAAFIAAVVKSDERTAVMGVTSMLRTLSGSLGPSITGVLAGKSRFWIAFVAAGALRLMYDIGLWALFVNMKLYGHEKGGDGKGEEELELDERKDGDVEGGGRVSAKEEDD